MGERYPPLLERHHELLRAAFSRHGGVEFKSEGDALLVAFASAADGVRGGRGGAATIWRTSRGRPTRTIRVRMGLHTGIAYPRDGDYIALALHQAARVVGTGNGGQVIASADAVAAAGQVPGIEVRPLGAYRLRDFEGPQQLHRVCRGRRNERDEPVHRRCGPSLPKATTFRRRSTPSSAGRESTKSWRLSSDRDGSSPCSGPVAWARRASRSSSACRPRRRGTTACGWWTSAPIAPGESINESVARGAGRRAGRRRSRRRDRRPPARPARCSSCSTTASTSCPTCESSSAAVLRHCARTGVLATSRERLGVPGEHAAIVPPLPLAEEAVDLFVDRARRRGATFPMGSDDLSVMVEICRRLDGMPLAIELAAARGHRLVTRARSWPASAIAWLRCAGATTSSSSASGRCARLIDWSYDLLDADEQAVFRRLSVFAGASTRSTAAAAAGHSGIDAGRRDRARLVAGRQVARQRRASRRVDALPPARNRPGRRARVQRSRRRRSTQRVPRSASATSQIFRSSSRGNTQWRARLALEHATIVQLVTGLVADDELDTAYALARISVEDAAGRGVVPRNDPLPARRPRLVDRGEGAAPRASTRRLRRCWPSGATSTKHRRM